MEKRRCKACDRLFVPCPKVPRQEYCSFANCQKTRRCLWQKQKLDIDEDYRQNQADAQRRWRERHRDYWRRYRETHPDYTRRNRERQRERNRHRHSSKSPEGSIAKMDLLEAKSPVLSGTYRLVPLLGDGIAKMDEIIVKIQILSMGYGDIGLDCKEMT